MMFGRELRLPDVITLEEPPKDPIIQNEFALHMQDPMKESGEKD